MDVHALGSKEACHIAKVDSKPCRPRACYPTRKAISCHTTPPHKQNHNKARMRQESSDSPDSFCRHGPSMQVHVDDPQYMNYCTTPAGALVVAWKNPNEQTDKENGSVTFALRIIAAVAREVVCRSSAQAKTCTREVWRDRQAWQGTVPWLATCRFDSLVAQRKRCFRLLVPVSA